MAGSSHECSFFEGWGPLFPLMVYPTLAYLVAVWLNVPARMAVTVQLGHQDEERMREEHPRAVNGRIWHQAWRIVASEPRGRGI